MRWPHQIFASPGPLLLLAKGSVVLGAVLLTAVLFLVNGVHILARGEFPRFTKAGRARKALPWLPRIVLGAFYLAMAAALAIIAGRLWFRLI